MTTKTIQRSDRPVANDSDKSYEINLNETASYGWPDFFDNAEPATDGKFQSNKTTESLTLLMQDHPQAEEPPTFFEPAHAGVIQMAFANEAFGFEGEAFAAQMSPNVPTPPEQGIVGQNIVRVNADNGAVADFLTLENPSSSFKPTDVLFENDNGTALHIVDCGNISASGTTPNSGVLWKITRTNTTSNSGSGIDGLEC